MTPIKKILAPFKSYYAAAKALDVNAMQLSRLSKAEAQADEAGQVWIKSKTVIKMDKQL